MARPDVAQNAPASHESGAADPSGQYEPGAHRFASGAAVVLLAGQKYPAAHNPVGALSPGVPQKLPAVHARHSERCVRRVTLLNEPAGHGNCVPNSVLGGQKWPTGHTDEAE